MAQTGYTPILIYSSSTAAAAPAAGGLTNSTLGSELAINITDGKLFYKDNANAVQVIGWKTTPTTAGGTGLTSYTAGDLIYYASGTTFTKLAIGANATILTSSGTAPQWTAASSVSIGTATNLAGGLAGSLPYQSGAGATTFLGIGAANTVLTSSGSAPQWSTALTLSGNVTAAALIPSSSSVPTNGMYLSTTNEVSIATNSTQRVKFGATGNMSFTTADAGVVFNKTSSLVNSTLNDYETGTWTPVLTGDGGGSGQSYTTQSGTYSKIGRIVTVSFYIELSAKGTITGNAIINNLPFTVINSNSNIMGGALSLWSNLAVNHYVLGGYCNNNSTNFYFWGSTAAAATPPLLTTTDIGNTTRFWGSVTYIAAS